MIQRKSEFFIGLNKGFFISSTDGCRTFDQTGDGYCRGDVVAVVVSKVRSIF
ncbi:hypothetical protein C8J57DRAFT_1274273 [Mycena rebaudengoi]|nr:hypothetical protein C8J57DRAFT_1274273 [Mycena rebaudengoi]